MCKAVPPACTLEARRPPPRNFNCSAVAHEKYRPADAGLSRQLQQYKFYVLCCFKNAPRCFLYEGIDARSRSIFSPPFAFVSEPPYFRPQTFSRYSHQLRRPETGPEVPRARGDVPSKPHPKMMRHVIRKPSPCPTEQGWDCSPLHHRPPRTNHQKD